MSGTIKDIKKHRRKIAGTGKSRVEHRKRRKRRGG